MMWLLCVLVCLGGLAVKVHGKECRITEKEISPVGQLIIMKGDSPKLSFVQYQVIGEERVLIVPESKFIHLACRTDTEQHVILMQAICLNTKLEMYAASGLMEAFSNLITVDQDNVLNSRCKNEAIPEYELDVSTSEFQIGFYVAEYVFNTKSFVENFFVLVKGIFTKGVSPHIGGYVSYQVDGTELLKKDLNFSPTSQDDKPLIWEVDMISLPHKKVINIQKAQIPNAIYENNWWKLAKIWREWARLNRETLHVFTGLSLDEGFLWTLYWNRELNTCIVILFNIYETGDNSLMPPCLPVCGTWSKNIISGYTTGGSFQCCTYSELKAKINPFPTLPCSGLFHIEIEQT